MFSTSSAQGTHATLAALVDDMLREDRDPGVFERRSAHRQPFMRPVSILPRRGDGESMQAFSKNISTLGIGLVVDREVEPGTYARLRVHRVQGGPVVILAECRWCDQFGDGWFITGWNFVNLARD